jgi:hypothetical protein
MGRNEDEHALRDAVLLTAAGDDPGPGRKGGFGLQKGFIPKTWIFLKTR